MKLGTSTTKDGLKVEFTRVNAKMWFGKDTAGRYHTLAMGPKRVWTHWQSGVVMSTYSHEDACKIVVGGDL